MHFLSVVRLGIDIDDLDIPQFVTILLSIIILHQHIRHKDVLRGVVLVLPED